MMLPVFCLNINPTNPIGFMKFFCSSFCDKVIRVINELTMV